MSRRLAALAAGLLSAAAPLRAAPPQGPAGLDRCIARYSEAPLLDPKGAWARELSTATAAALAPAYSGLRECLGLAGRDLAALPVPPELKLWVPEDSGLWDLLRFYRSCGTGPPDAALAACKPMVKTYLDGYLAEDADYDELCGLWCRSFKTPDTKACTDAVKRFSDDRFADKEPLAAQCRQNAALERSDCSGSEAQRAECERRASLVQAVRSGKGSGCAPDQAWRCAVAAGADAQPCLKRFKLALALSVCRSGGK